MTTKIISYHWRYGNEWYSDLKSTRINVRAYWYEGVQLAFQYF